MADSEKRIHPFFASQTQWRLPRTDRSTLLDLPPEVRLVIYGYAMKVDFAIAKLAKKPDNNDYLDQHLTDIRRITDCFNLMQTCRTVHQEAAPIFWGENWLIVHAAPTYGLWPRPDVREEDKSIQFDAENNKWNTTLSVESAESQKMIRNLCWVFPYDPWHKSHGRWEEDEPGVFPGLDVVPSNLSNVRKLCIGLDSELARFVHFPTLDEVESLVEKGQFDAKVLHRLDRRADLLRDAETFTDATVHAIRHFAFTLLPKIQEIGFVSERKLSVEGDFWYGKELTALPSDCLYLKRIMEAFKDTDKMIKYGGVFDSPERCRYCLAPWDKNHRSKTNNVKVCPGLGGNEAD